MYRRSIGCLAALLLTAAALPAKAADGPTAPAAPRYYVPEVPADLGPVDFYLITVGLGDDVAARFGHTGIRIKNPEEGTDVVFNWGKFYFDDPSFLWKFFRGELNYSMGVRTFQGDVMHYMTSGQRVVMDKLNLTTKQKRRLMEKIAWNAVPEHRNFQYQYWYKNCATIPRDYLDEVLEGQVRAKFYEKPAGKAFRDYVRTNLSYSPFVAPGLDILMNSNIDRPITAWEEMFLPGKLRENLAAMASVDDEGNPVPGTQLLSDNEVLLDTPEPLGAPVPDYFLMMAPTTVLGGLALAFYLFARGRGEESRLAYRLLGLATLAWGVIGGLFGVTLALNWAFSGHPDGWHNVNLLIFWPVDWLLVPIGWAIFRSARAIKDRRPFVFAGQALCYGHLAALALLVALASAHVIQQNIWRVAGWYGVPLVGLTLLLSMVGFGYRASVVADKVMENPGKRKAAPA